MINSANIKLPFNVMNQNTKSTKLTYYITVQANGLYAIYTNTNMPSMAEERLIKWDIDNSIDAIDYVTNTLNGSYLLYT